MSTRPFETQRVHSNMTTSHVSVKSRSVRMPMKDNGLTASCATHPSNTAWHEFMALSAFLQSYGLCYRHKDDPVFRAKNRARTWNNNKATTPSQPWDTKRRICGKSSGENANRVKWTYNATRPQTWIFDRSIRERVHSNKGHGSCTFTGFSLLGLMVYVVYLFLIHLATIRSPINYKFKKGMYADWNNTTPSQPCVTKRRTCGNPLSVNADRLVV
jgi:hypothetical protein